MSSQTGADPCARFEAALPSLLDLSGEGDILEAEVRAELLAHGEACPGCTGLRKSYAATVELLRGLPRRHAPAGFLGWVRGEIEKESSSRRARRGPAWWLSAAAVLALAGTLIFIFARPAPIEIARLEKSVGDRTFGAPGLPGVEAVPPVPGEPRDLAAFSQDFQSSLPGQPSAPTTMLAAAAEPAPPVIAIHVPVQGRWAEDLQGLETDLRARFEAPPGKESTRGAFKRGAAPPPAATSRPDGEARQVGEVSARPAVPAAEPDRARTAVESAAPAASPPAAKAETFAAATEFTLTVDRRQFLGLVASLSEWASRRGGQLASARFDLDGGSAAAMGQDRLQDARGPAATAAAPAEGLAAERDSVEQPPAAPPAPAGEERIQVRIRIEPTPARRE
jgi:hypothetical protein